MTTLELLKQQKAALDSQIAEATRIEQALQQAQALQLMREREAEITKGTAEIHALMTKYKLTKNDVFNEGSPRPKLALVDFVRPTGVAGKKTLEEMRQFYKQF